ncbi:MAG: glycoside hydrolase family 9 protein [Micromonosporaceae bacterium]|nr:glycoside hydrolase family 9 protein [Micromonosporaceae bacterium]
MSRPPRRYRRTSLVAAVALAIAACTVIAGSANADPVEQVQNGGFDNGLSPWWWTGNLAPAVDNGQMCVTIPGGTTNPWDAIFGQNDIPMVNGQSYAFSFTASASKPVGILAIVQMATDPFTGQINQPVTLSTTPTQYSFTFTSNVDDAHQTVQFQAGGSADPWQLCLDDISVEGGVAPPVYTPDTGPRVRVNQVGYLPDGPKVATVVTDATDPLPWQLTNSAGTVVATGNATPRGMDAASGLNVQNIDFGRFHGTGTGFTLTADGETSYPFAISKNIYTALRSDSLQFFYIQRSGIAIDGNLVGQQYARPAGHVGVPPNQGDTAVPCQPGVCDYTLNVAGGWYDAGDQGKYVVNGGIATAQLLGAYERTLTARSATRGALGDSTLRVPERGNHVPDILDEARWELQFLVSMQVPAGQPLAGMVHHKVHDENWTGLPLQPQNDPQPRQLHPPSTAATLNMAAAAAQGARLFWRYDPVFAHKLLTAAQTAYAAAKAHPAMYASVADGNGGGTYDDTNVTDEFYWAAAELFITTGGQQYLTDLLASPHFSDDVFAPGGFSWQSVAALGRLDLATVPNRLPHNKLAAVRASVVAGADKYLGILAGQAWGLPLPADAYVWGSNSNILNNIQVIATAYDLTGQAKYRSAALQGLDYIFGRNALNHSFVTGYGTVSSQNQHTRIYAHELDPNLPNPPVGSISGGANAVPADPLAQRLLTGCAPQFCYIDDIQSYSTNEVAINWNSALAWVASFAADQGTHEGD